MEPVLSKASQRIQAALDHLKRELATIRAGRANPTLIEDVPVNVYGTKMKLVELGTISTPQPSLLTIQIWDASIVSDVAKALQGANLGFNPSTEGQIIRLPIPPLTSERREEFIRVVHQKMEAARIEIRRIRQDVREGWDQEQEAGEFGEDEFDRRSKILQELIDKTMSQIEEMGKAKEDELARV